MAISCIRHYRPAHKLVTAHLECLASLRVCPPPPLRVSFLPTPAFLAPSFSLRVYPPSIRHLSSLLRSSRAFLLSFGRLLVASFCFSSSSFFFFASKCLPPSRLHSGGEASIVIVPHQRRSAINLSPCRAESERCSPAMRADHTRNTGRAINLRPPTIV